MVKNRVSRCNGVSAKLHSYSPEAVKLFDNIVGGLRLVFLREANDPELWQGEVLVGPRVMSDTDVLMTLRSSATEEQFQAEPFTWVQDALQNCAERDWWYANEKRWDEERELDHRDEFKDEI